jgi:hypothetical protein
MYEFLHNLDPKQTNSLSRFCNALARVAEASDIRGGSGPHSAFVLQTGPEIAKIEYRFGI